MHGCERFVNGTTGTLRVHAEMPMLGEGPAQWDHDRMHMHAGTAVAAQPLVLSRVDSHHLSPSVLHSSSLEQPSSGIR